MGAAKEQRSDFDDGGLTGGGPKNKLKDQMRVVKRKVGGQVCDVHVFLPLPSSFVAQ